MDLRIDRITKADQEKLDPWADAPRFVPDFAVVVKWQTQGTGCS
jgi:hypothetical protein